MGLPHCFIDYRLAIVYDIVGLSYLFIDCL